MARLTPPHGYTVFEEAPDGAVIFYPDSVAHLIPTTCDVNDGRCAAPQSGDTVSPNQPTLQVCTRCKQPQLPEFFKRFYTAKQAIQRGYAKPNPLFGKEEGQPAYLRIPKVTYESEVCKTCQPQAPFYPKTPRGLAFARSAGLLHYNPDGSDLVYTEKMQAMRERAVARVLRKNHLRETKRRLLSFMARTFSEEHDRIQRRYRYLNAVQETRDLPAREWREFLTDYQDALYLLRHDPQRDRLRLPEFERVDVETVQERIERQAREAAMTKVAIDRHARDVQPYNVISKSMFDYAKIWGTQGWDSSMIDEDKLLRMWVERMCSRARADEQEKPFGPLVSTKVQKVVERMAVAIKSWYRCTGKMHREKTMPALLAMFEAQIKE